MKRYPGMNGMRALLLAAALVAGACGGETSVASKSAAAYREAEAKGAPLGGGHDHGGHAATETSATADHSGHGAAATRGATDHSAHGTGADAHAGMNHGTAANTAASTSGSVDHSAHGGATTSHAAAGHGGGATNAHAGHSATADHAAMGHSTARTSTTHARHAAVAAAAQHAQHGTQAVAGRTDHSQHGAVQATPAGASTHANHATTAGRPATVIQVAPRGSSEMHPTQPATTLRPDPFDAPAASSVSEAAKAAQGGGHAGHEARGITAGEDDENPPTPMPATRDGSTRHPATDHGQHDATVIYSCPMHPEVTSDQPGTCPKCGMALVQKNR
jgi:hypothetical protein